MSDFGDLFFSYAVKLTGMRSYLFLSCTSIWCHEFSTLFLSDIIELYRAINMIIKIAIIATTTITPIKTVLPS
jgi:hypothetical protein